MPARERPSEHLHDGFYLRAGLGVARPTARLTLASGVVSDLTGAGVALDLAIGAAPIDGLVFAIDLGGFGVARAGRVDLGGESIAARDLDVSRLGLLIDVYPAPRRGVHVQGGAGLFSASYALGGAAPSGPFRSTGFGWNLGVGLESWVDAQASIGVVARVDGASLEGAGADGTRGETLHLLAPSVLFAATFQ